MRKTAIDPEGEPTRDGSATNESLDLVDFGGKGKYSAPEYDLFVASFNLGEIYDFDLNANRTKLEPSNKSNSTIMEKT